MCCSLAIILLAFFSRFLDGGWFWFWYGHTPTHISVGLASQLGTSPPFDVNCKGGLCINRDAQTIHTLIKRVYAVHKYTLKRIKSVTLIFYHSKVLQGSNTFLIIVLYLRNRFCWIYSVFPNAHCRCFYFEGCVVWRFWIGGFPVPTTVYNYYLVHPSETREALGFQP